MESNQVRRANLIMLETQLLLGEVTTVISSDKTLLLETQMLLCEVTSIISSDESLLLVIGEKGAREAEVL